MTDDLSMFEHVAAQADTRAEAEEEAEQTLAEITDLVATQKLYFAALVESGMPVEVAKESTIELAGGYWAARFADQFRMMRRGS